MTDAPKERELDGRHMALRAAVFQMRKLAHGIMATGGTKAARTVAEDFFDRCSAALYPSDDDHRREPLSRLLDEARADEARDYRNTLCEIRDKLAGTQVPDGPARESVETCVRQIDDFLRACDGD